MIDAIFFDFSGTLVKGEFDVSSCRKSVVGLLTSEGYTVMLPQYNRAMDLALMRRKERSEGGLVEIPSELLTKQTLRSLNIPASRDLIAQIEDVEFKHYHWRLFPDAREILEEISHEYHLGIISNSRSNSPIRVLKEEGLIDLFDEIILSKDIGFRKPDFRIFGNALNRMRIRADEALFIGDSFVKDVRGAKEIGMHTIWLTDEEGDVPYGCDAVASALKDIPRLVAKLSNEATDLEQKLMPPLHVIQLNS